MKFYAINNCGDWLDIEVSIWGIEISDDKEPRAIPSRIVDDNGNEYPAAFDEDYHVLAIDTDSDGRVIGTDSQVIYGLEVG